MARRITRLAAVMLIVLLGGVPAVAQMPAPPKTTRCTVPPDLIASDPALPGIAKRFHDRQPVVIVAIGGASTAGVAAGGAAAAYPHRLQEALARRHPGVPITVMNKGIPRQTTRDMIRRFATDVLAARPNLVIWETGTVDAVRAEEVEEFAMALDEGITDLRAGGAAVMLVNMQYNPGLTSVIDFGPYLDAMDRAADLDDVYLFDRYRIMRYWNDNDRFNVVDVPSSKQTALASDIYRCLGETMAGAIDRAAR